MFGSWNLRLNVPKKCYFY